MGYQLLIKLFPVILIFWSQAGVMGEKYYLVRLRMLHSSLSFNDGAEVRTWAYGEDGKTRHLIDDSSDDGYYGIFNDGYYDLPPCTEQELGSGLEFAINFEPSIVSESSETLNTTLRVEKSDLDNGKVNERVSTDETGFQIWMHKIISTDVEITENDQALEKVPIKYIGWKKWVRNIQNMANDLSETVLSMARKGRKAKSCKGGLIGLRPKVYMIANDPAASTDIRYRMILRLDGYENTTPLTYDDGKGNIWTQFSFLPDNAIPQLVEVEITEMNSRSRISYFWPLNEIVIGRKVEAYSDVGLGEPFTCKVTILSSYKILKIAEKRGGFQQ